MAFTWFSLLIQGLISIDYEAEVEDDIEPIFRRGEVSDSCRVSQRYVKFLDMQRYCVLRVLPGCIRFLNKGLNRWLSCK